MLSSLQARSHDFEIIDAHSGIKEVLALKIFCIIFCWINFILEQTLFTTSSDEDTFLITFDSDYLRKWIKIDFFLLMSRNYLNFHLVLSHRKAVEAKAPTIFSFVFNFRKSCKNSIKVKLKDTLLSVQPINLKYLHLGCMDRVQFERLLLKPSYSDWS